MRPMEEFFNQKRVLLTGNTGFKGSWMQSLLQRLGAECIGFSNNTEQIFFNLLPFKEQTIIGDINNFEEINSCIESFKPEIIIHMAAQSLVQQSYLDPFETYLTNVLGTMNVLRSSSKKDFIKSLCIVTSDKCYENNETGVPYIETDYLGGNDIYSSSKACCEILVKSYTNSILSMDNPHTKVVSVRAGNVIGGIDMSLNRLVPDIYRSRSNNNILQIRNPSSTRPWQHVLDPLWGYLCAIRESYNSLLLFDCYNFGPEIESNKTVLEVVEAFSKVFTDLKYAESFAKDQYKESSLLSLDSSKAKNNLNWKPLLNFSESIRLTANGYQAYSISNEAFVAEMHKQIEDYISLAYGT